METIDSKILPNKVSADYFKLELIKNYIYNRASHPESSDIDCAESAYSTVNDDTLNIYLPKAISANNFQLVKDIHAAYTEAVNELDEISDKIETFFEQEIFLGKSLLAKCTQFHDLFMQRAMQIFDSKNTISELSTEEIEGREEFKRFVKFIFENKA